MAEVTGQPLNRIDGRLKVTGRAPYTAEHPVSHAAHGVLVMSTIAKGRITSIDTQAAERTPDVIAVLTHLNAPKLPDDPGPKGSTRSAARKLQLLQDDRIHYANQPIAVVVADTLEAATEAARLVRVTYAVEPPELSLEPRRAQAYAPKQAGAGGDPTDSSRGDVNAGLASVSDSGRIEQVYITPFETHSPMEPHATIAVWDGPDKLTLYDATQGIFGNRQRVADLLGLQPDNVRVISPYLGGGFGSKGPVWSHVVLTAMAARHVNRPVKLVLRRPQMFGPIGFRTETRQSVRAAAKPDGTMVAFEHETLEHTSEFDEFVEAASLVARMLYACPNVATTHRLVRSSIGTPSYMRAPGEAPGNFGVESAIDELAYAVKMDPLAFRLKNYADEDPDKQLPWSSKSLRECYQRGAERFGWNKRPMDPRTMRDGHTLIGWGMATACYPTRRSAAGATARLFGDGTALVESGTQDLGTGTYTIMTQLAADALGLPMSQVTFRLGDTQYPETPVSGGSQTAASTGSAVHAASMALRDKLIGMAIADQHSPLFQARADEIIAADGRLALARDPQRGETYQALIARHGLKQVEATAKSEPGEEKKQYSMYGFGAQFAEVRVDADLGQIRVSRMLGVFATGRILNAKTARSQFMGGMVWGLGMALEEHTQYDERLGRIVNNNLAEYHVPVNADVPSIDVEWVDEQDSHINPIGAKGIGEIGITGSVDAIVNAIFHATGRRVRDLPVTLDKLL